MRILTLAENQGVYKLTCSGLAAKGFTVEEVVASMARSLGISETEPEVHSLFEASELLEEMLGEK